MLLIKICNTAKNKYVIKLLENFVRNLKMGVYACQRNGKHSELVSEHGNFIRLIPTHDRFVEPPEKNADCRFEDIFSERGDLNSNAPELDTFDLLTVFGEPDYLTNLDDNLTNPDDFKYFDFFDENGEIHADTLWSSPNHGNY